MPLQIKLTLTSSHNFTRRAGGQKKNGAASSAVLNVSVNHQFWSFSECRRTVQIMG